MLVCTIPGKLPTLNEIIRSRAAHWAIYSKQKSLWSSIIIQLLPDNIKETFPKGPIKVSCVWGLRRNADIDNCTSKFILDSFTEVGLIEDDNCTIVREVSHKAEISKERYVRVYVESCEEIDTI